MDCQILDMFKSDFSALWQCKSVGGSVEVSTPFMLPDSRLLSIFLTERPGKFIACEGGVINEILEESCGMPPEEIAAIIDAYKVRFSVSQTSGERGIPLYYKSSPSAGLITSVSFDLANFTLAVIGALVGNFDEESPTEIEATFPTQANAFLRRTLANSEGVAFNREIREVPGVRFSAVINSSNMLWVVQYINGSTLPNFRRSITDSIFNFGEAERSSIRTHLARKVSLVNNEARGYIPAKLGVHLERLQESSENSVVSWTNKEDIAALLA